MLIVVAVVLVVGIGLTNSTDIWAKLFQPPPPKPKDDPAAEQKVNTLDMVKSASKSNAPKNPEEAPVQTGIPDEPSIFQPKFKRYDPQPNETSTTAHWYDKDSSEQVRKAELEKKRGY